MMNKTTDKQITTKIEKKYKQKKNEKKIKKIKKISIHGEIVRHINEMRKGKYEVTKNEFLHTMNADSIQQQRKTER